MGNGAREAIAAATAAPATAAAAAAATAAAATAAAAAAAVVRRATHCSLPGATCSASYWKISLQRLVSAK